MGKKEFEALLKKHENKPVEKEIDWDKQKEEWLAFVELFFTSIENWLSPYKEGGTVSYEYKKIDKNEDYIGHYTADKMLLTFAGQHLSIEPIGTLLIGTKGRIDMEGSKGLVKFILADKDHSSLRFKVQVTTGGKAQEGQQRGEPNWTWKIAVKETRGFTLEEFTEENFFNAVMAIVND